MEFSWTPTDTPLVGGPLRLHHPNHKAASAAIDKPAQWLSLTVSGQPAGSALIGRRSWRPLGEIAILGRGPHWHPDFPVELRASALKDLIGTLAECKRGVMAAPDLILGADALAGSSMLPVVTPVSVAELPLTSCTKTLRSRLCGKWRNRLRKAEQTGLTVRSGLMPTDPAHWLLAAEANQRRQAGYKGLPFAYTHAWVNAGGRKSARLFTAESQGRIVGGMLFLLHSPGASYHIGWTNAEGRLLGAHPLLMWHAMTWLSERSFSVVDLDVIDTENEPGLARFKLGTGAQVVTLGATRLVAPGTRLIARVLPSAA